MNEKLNEVEAKYLKKIYVIIFEEGGEVTSYVLAKHFDVKPPSSIDVLKRLEKKGLISRKAWGPITLTDKGVRVARELVHVHRVMESFFCEYLGLSLNVACREASKLDYLISKEVAKSICKMQNKPKYCPHGYEIPHNHR